MGIFLGERRLLATFPEPLIPPFRGAWGAGDTRTNVANRPEQALMVPTVWACVGLISNAVSMLPLETYERTPGGIPGKVDNPPLLISPFGDMTQAEWLHMLLVSMLLRGNAIGLIIGRDSLQRPTQVQLLNPDSVKIDVDRNTGALTYTLHNTAGRQVELPLVDIWHVRGMTMPGSRIGLSPISYAAGMLGVDLAARQFAADFFNGGGIPKAVLTTDKDVSEDQSIRIKERLLAATRRREPTILGGGTKYQAVSVNPEESQFLATHAQTVSEVARIFHVPAGMVGGSEGGSMTYANVEQRSLDFLVHCVQPWLQRLEQAIGALLPANRFVRFDTGLLLRTDARTQAEVDNMKLAGKVLVPSEIRNRDGRPPFTLAQQTEADMVPLTITPMGTAKALPALKSPPGPSAPVPAGDQSPQLNSAPHLHLHMGDTNVEVPPMQLRLEQPINVEVAPASPAQVRFEQPINVEVQPSRAPEVRIDQPITVQPSPAPEVRITQAAPVAAKTVSRRVERDDRGDITRIIEE